MDKVGVGKTLGGERLGWNPQDLGKVHQGMARDGKGKLRLETEGALRAGDQQGAGIEDGGEGRQPGLIVMLRAEITEHGNERWLSMNSADHASQSRRN